MKKLSITILATLLPALTVAEEFTVGEVVANKAAGHHYHQYKITQFYSDGQVSFERVSGNGSAYWEGTTSVVTKINPPKATAKSVSIQSLPQNLTELSNVVYDNPSNPKAWSRARLTKELGEDLSKSEMSSEKQNSNILLLYAMNSFVEQLTSKVIETDYKPLYVNAMTELQKSRWNNIDQVELELSTINMAISIIEKTLLTVEATAAQSENSIKNIRKYVSRLARDVSTPTTELRRGMALAHYAEGLIASGLVNSILENPRTAPEGAMLNAVLGWIAKK